MWRLPYKSFRQTRFWACLFCALLVGASTLGAQHKGNRLRPRYLSNQPPDPERGREVIDASRRLGLAGDYYLAFDLEVLPRRGDRRTVAGQMWGTRTEDGAVFRAELQPTPEAAPERVLAINGPEPRAWRWSAAQEVTTVDAAGLLDPIAGTNLSLFELQMPFLFWEDYVYEGTTEVRGRAVHAFLMYPPADFAAAHPEIAGVRLHLDANFNALMQAVFLDADEAPSRKMTVLDLKKLQGQWIVKSIEVRDESTRDKVKFEVNAAALELNFSASLFTPDYLSEDVAAPDSVRQFRW